MTTTTPIVGIDLGTTFSAVAIVREGQPHILPKVNERILPSVVGYSPQGEWLVGTPARNQLLYAPESTVRSIKRKMGGDETVALAGRAFTPQEISAFILRELKTVAESHLGQPVERAVITVPAFFSDAQRQATKDAGRIAGLTVERIINEPTAAALAYGLDPAGRDASSRDEDQLVLVYDLGGGTFDVSLVELAGGVVEVRASHGNTRLGGDDFDQRLAEHVLSRFEAAHGLDLRGDRAVLARVRRAAEAAKIHLSSHPFAWLREEYLAEKRGTPLHLEEEIARDELVRMIDDLLQKTRVSIDRVLQDAGLIASDLDKVLLVGGSTRIPAVWELVAEHTGLEPRSEVNPDEAVALGAAVQAAIIAGLPVDAILVDVTPHSLGIEVAQIRRGEIIPDRYKMLIRRNSAIPVTAEEVFYTLFPGQDTVHVKVYQGESSTASQNTLLGDFMFTDLEPENPGELARFTVSFDLDVNGILHVETLDRGSGAQGEITVTASRQRLSDVEISAAQARLAKDATPLPQEIADEANVLLSRAEALLAQGSLGPSDAGILRQVVEDATAARLLGDGEALQTALDELLELLFELEDGD
jgi:molecular chaperone DnaK